MLAGKLHGLGAGFETVWGKGFRTPKEVRASLPAGKQVVAFQNRNPVHKAHFELLVPRHSRPLRCCRSCPVLSCACKVFFSVSVSFVSFTMPE